MLKCRMFRLKKDWLLAVVFVLLFIVLRSFHFTTVLNFSYDQGFFSMKALDLWRTKTIVMIGPTASLNYEGHYTFQGSVIYYLLMIFMLIGQWNPVWGSYVFMLFAATMCLPLYYGVKFLMDRKAAVIATSFYCFFPLYIDYTRFLWNPNFQFALMPLIILMMGLFKKTKNIIFSF